MVQRKIQDRSELWLRTYKRWKYYRHEAKDPVYIGELINS